MESLLQDLRYALRMLLKNPGFTSVALATLAVGISSSTAIFSVVEAVLLRPLPYPQADRLFMLYETLRPSGEDGAVSPANYIDWEAQQDGFSSIAAYRSWPANLSDGSRPERVLGAMTTPSLFAVLGLKPLLGRTLAPEDAQAGGDQVAVLSYGLWKRRFGSDPAVIGRSIRLNSEPHTVVGVLPPTSNFYAELWVCSPRRVPTHPLMPDQDPAQFRDRHYLDVLARLKPGVTRAQAAARLDSLARRLEKQYPDTNRDRTIGLYGLQEDAVYDIRPTLLTLLAAVGFVLLIACVNVANLLLARGSAREKELAIRAALGAGRGRIVRQLLTESVLLALLAGAAALLLTLWLAPAVFELSPPDIQVLGNIAPERPTVDLPLLTFALALSALTGVVFGLTPALRGTRLHLNQRLKEGGRGAETSSSGSRARSLLVAGEIALSLVLLVGAGLMIRSFSRLLEVRPGFNPEALLVFSLTAPPSQSSERQIAEYQTIVERLRSLPGVAAAGAVSRLPLSRGNSARSFNLAGDQNEYQADLRVATAGYFRTLGIPLLQGRDFSAHDLSAAPPVAIVNRALVRRLFPDQDPIGKHFSFFPDQPIVIVGVVGAVRHHGLETAPHPEIYLPLTQSYWPSMTVAVRSVAADPLALVPSVERAVWSIDAEMPLADLKTMDRVVSDSVARRRFSVLLLSVFAGVALLLAAIGLYGVIAYAVSQRTREFAIRMALGARSGQVVYMILREALLVTLVGVAVGVVAALGLTRLISGLLFGVAPTDPWTFGWIALLLALVALLAAAAPARRATRVDPLVALRCE